jgi:hypothetical protein
MSVASSLRPLAGVLFVSIAACGGRDAQGADAGADAASRAIVLEPIVVPSFAATINVPAGRTVIGSRPGSLYRDPTTEAALAAVELGAFEIDRLPYPNDPSKPPLTNVSLSEAERLCEADGKRLCDETEWERACRSPLGNTFSTGETVDVEACALDPGSCVTPEGIVIGTSLVEWTHGAAGDRTTVRGASAADPVGNHRCSARHSARTAASPQIGFRCCRSASEAPAYPAPPRLGAAWSSRPIERDRIREILRTVPELRAHADTFEPATSSELDRALSRGGRVRSTIGGWQIIENVGVWSPVAGEEVWLLSGRIGDRTLLAAIFPTAQGTYVHGASLVVEEPLSIAVAFNQEAPLELLWSTCWGCGGEGGAIRRRDDGTYVIEPR